MALLGSEPHDFTRPAPKGLDQRTNAPAHTWHAPLEQDVETARLCRGEANIDSPVPPCEREETRPTAVERPERQNAVEREGPTSSFWMRHGLCRASGGLWDDAVEDQTWQTWPWRGCVGLHTPLPACMQWWLGSAAAKDSMWSLCTAIAAHHVAWGRVLDSQSHSFCPCSVFCICCFSAEAPVKAINKDRIGQAGAVDLHLHILTAVIVVCIDFAHCPPHLHLATQPAALPMSESAQESVAHFYLIRRVRRRP